MCLVILSRILNNRLSWRRRINQRRPNKTDRWSSMHSYYSNNTQNPPGVYTSTTCRCDTKRDRSRERPKTKTKKKIFRHSNSIPTQKLNNHKTHLYFIVYNSLFCTFLFLSLYRTNSTTKMNSDKQTAPTQCANGCGFFGYVLELQF